LKLSAADGAEVWRAVTDGAAHGTDEAMAIVLDSSGNAVVAGKSAGASSWDYLTVKLSAAAGAELWRQVYNGTSNLDDRVYAMAINGNDAVFVAGTSNEIGKPQGLMLIKYTESISANEGCASANGVLANTAPVDGLCLSGAASAVASSVSAFTWSCTGTSTAYCYAPRGYALTATAGLHGSVAPASQLIGYNHSGAITIIPQSGFHTTVTSPCGGTLTGNTYTTGQMTSACTVSVSFSPNNIVTTYPMTVNKTGKGLGLVLSDLIGIDCGGDCSEGYAAGSTVILSATPWTGSQFAGWSGACSGTGICAVTLDAAKNVSARFNWIPTSNNTGAALDNTGLVWTTGGDADWTLDSSTHQAGGSSIRSGAIGHGQSSWLLTTVRGPATLTYYWKVSSEANHDQLRFYLDGIEQPGAISGAVNWTRISQSLPAGPHELAWEYRKDGSGQAGSDAGWLDSVKVLPFADIVDGAWSANYANALFNAGITTGCGGGNYCANDNVTREQMAVFLVRAKEGDPVAGYCGASAPFTDVATDHWACGHIKRLKELGITNGLGDGSYNPLGHVTRGQMAAFIVRAKEGNPATDYCAGGSLFPDVAIGSTFCTHIKRLRELNVTTGYADGTYGPDNLVTREQMAAFLSRAFLGMP
jgi:hypothetical protein